MKTITQLSKRWQIAVFSASTLISILMYLNAYDNFDEIKWFPFGVAAATQILKSVIDFAMGRDPVPSGK